MKWTKARVIRAYREWEELSRHVEDVLRRHREANGWDSVDTMSNGLKLPGWTGTGWPGNVVEIEVWSGGDEPTTLELPIEYLWTDAWEVRQRKAHEAWRSSRDGKKQESEERALYERLKAKFDRHA